MARVNASSTYVELIAAINDKLDTAELTRAALVALIGNATDSLSGLMSATDKTNLDTLVEMLNNNDPNLIDTLAEILEIFSKYPQGVDIISYLNENYAKKADLNALKLNTYYIVGSFIAEKGGIGTTYDLSLSLITPTTPTIVKGNFVTFYTTEGNSYTAMVSTVSSTKVSAMVYFAGNISAEVPEIEVGEGLKKEGSVISLLGATKDTFGGVMVYIDEEGYLCIDTEKFEPDPILNNNSWEDIAKAQELDIAKDLWKVGDTKTIHIEGTVGTLEVNDDFDAVIIGINHNEEIEGKGITFQLFQKDGKSLALIDSKYNGSSTDGTRYFNMNHSSNTNSGGWKGCDMRYDILGSVHAKNEQYAASTTATDPVDGTLMAALPADLRAVMKPMTKWTNNTGYGSSESIVTETTDYLPLLSEWEIFGARVYANTYEQNYQKQYDYFAAGNKKRKYMHSSPTSLAIWWERSAYSNNTYYFCYVYTDVGAGTDGAYYSCGIAPIFKV